MQRKYWFITLFTILVTTSCAPKAGSEVTASLTSTISTSTTSTIGFPSVAAALNALKARTDVSTSTEGGWTTITEADGLTIWSFAPPTYSAYPAVAKRVLYQDQEAWKIKMDILCEADQTSCDQFERYFETLNEQMLQAIEQEHKP